eukprot:TRINITY_DN73950_c0_g1_i1.p1 TRINITY_DN73950_c0_g1~~TRINITY_DN73950_c0_g1_i1.p1  ORF type:complete len:307 (-),score=47.10 TRINITY_DN73950_c0_g1_i1:62-940(-)
MKCLHPRIDPKDVEHAKVDSEQHLKNLRADGALGVVRPVRVFATSAFTDDGEALRPLAAGEKRVHLIRHGQGFHNLLADIYRQAGKKFDSATGAGGNSNPYIHPAVLDPPLTEIGRRQARELQPLARKLSPELVVVSPMVRATQTGLLAFAHLLDGASTKVPFVAHDGCHEIAGVHTCDRRRSVKELRGDFPMIDYDVVPVEEEDPFWSETKRETPSELSGRGYDFLMWLRSRPETDIVVATHSAWLFALLNAVVECDDKTLTQWFVTGELRSFHLRFEDRMEPLPKRAKID